MRLERPRDPIGLGHRREHRHFLRPHEDAAVHACPDERRVRTLAQLVEPRVEHRRVQVVDDALAVRQDGRLLADRQLVEDRQRRRRQLRVGRNRVAGAGMVRHGEGRPRLRRHRRRDGAEPLLDQALDHGRVEITDGDDGHQVRAVPVPVELLQPLVRERLERCRRADRAPNRIPRSLEHDRKQLVLEPGRRPAPLAPFLDDDAPLLVDFAGVERQVVRPVLEDEQGLLEDLAAVGRHLQDERRVVERRECVQARPELHADRLHERRDLLAGKVLRAVEGHVLDDVRQPELIVLFEHRARVDHEAELGPLRGARVATDVVAQPVLQPPDGDAGVHRHPLGGGRQRRDRQRRRLARRRGLRLPGACRSGEDGQHQPGGGQQTRVSAHSHGGFPMKRRCPSAPRGPRPRAGGTRTTG